MAGKLDVVVIGGGYAGVMAVNRLTHSMPARVTDDKQRQLLRAKRGEALAPAE